MIFIGLTLVATIFRNYEFFVGYREAIEMRKMVIRAMYKRVTKMTLKSMVQINGAKLITLVSTDFFMFERALSIAVLPIVAVILNIAVYILIGKQYGWEYSAILCVLWIVTIVGQMIVSGLQK